MIRKVIHIDDSLCNGCGICARACHEGAIDIIDGKAKLIRENFCDGFGDCLPGCPQGAITFEERDVPEYDEAAVKAVQGRNWPVQIKLAPIRNAAFDDCDLLVAADCTAYAYAEFHRDFMKGRMTLIGCTKLDMTDYSEKLAAIFANNRIKSILVARMEVPCCGGMERAVKMAIAKSGKDIPLQVVTVGIRGMLLG